MTERHSSLKDTDSYGPRTFTTDQNFTIMSMKRAVSLTFSFFKEGCDRRAASVLLQNTLTHVETFYLFIGVREMDFAVRFDILTKFRSSRSCKFFKSDHLATWFPPDYVKINCCVFPVIQLFLTLFNR